MTDKRISMSAATMIIARGFGVSDEEIPAFQARVRHFRRIGLFPHIEKRKGASANLNREEVVLLAEATLLSVNGYSPEHATALVRGESFAVAGKPRQRQFLTEPQLGYFSVAVTVVMPSALLALLDDRMKPDPEPMPIAKPDPNAAWAHPIGEGFEWPADAEYRRMEAMEDART